MSEAQNKLYRGRIAPTPSGFLHLGHAQTFATAARRAKENGGKLVLRIEDIDAQRCKAEYVQAAIDDLKAVGLNWDEGQGVGGEFAPYTQSMRLEFYKEALTKLAKKGFAYPSNASRAQIKKEAIPQKRSFDFCESEPIFPPALREECRPLKNDSDFSITWRFKVPDGKKISFVDNACGFQSFVAGEDFGDFIIWRKEGAPSYELAVVEDDSAMRISEVVRGMDLLMSTARQILIYDALGLNIPEFYHCPLMKGDDGEKLSKSNMKNADSNPMLIRRSLKSAKK